MPPLSQSGRSRARALNSARRRLIKVEHRIGVVERATNCTRRRLTRVEKHVGASERLIREMRVYWRGSFRARALQVLCLI